MTVTLHNGDCLDIMRGMDANSVDTILTDPPYGLEFMGRDWDHGIPGEAYWAEALRVAKPGALLLAFGGTRTGHRLAVAIEDAGWELRDTLMWLYGSGFPKSHDISKAIDKAAGAEREVVATVKKKPSASSDCNPGWVRPWAEGKTTMDITAPATPLAAAWQGWGTALKPAWEPVIVAQKAIDGTYAANAETWGVAGLWIDGGRIGTDPVKTVGPADGGRKFARKYDHNGSNLPNATLSEHIGRWPANLLLSEDAAAEMGEVSRYFYCAKASRAERNAGLEGMTNGHPTVKPLALMRYLARLTKTPTGGVVLDPFMGSGTTGVAAVMEGRAFIGIEIDPTYYAIAEKRISEAQPALLEGRG